MWEQRNYTSRSSREIGMRTTVAIWLFAVWIAPEGLWFLPPLAVAGNHIRLLNVSNLLMAGDVDCRKSVLAIPTSASFALGINLIVCIHTFYFDPNTINHPVQLAHRHPIDWVIWAIGFPRESAGSTA